MKKALLLVLSLFAFSFSTVIVIPIEGEIEPGLASFLKRAIKDAEAKSPEAVIFEINTFGGQVETAFEISDLISGMKIHTLAYVKQKAISAGALIALSCKDVVMEPNTTIGDVAPIMVGQEGPIMMGEKFQSPLRAKFRSLAQKNGYPVKLCEAFVSTDMEFIEVTYKDSSRAMLSGVEYGDLTDIEKARIVRKKTLVPKGKLLTLTQEEALELGFSRATVKNLDEAVAFLKVAKPGFERLDQKRSEGFLIKFNKIAPLFLLLGLFGVYMEIKTPGFGLFGFLGIAAFLIFFGTKYVIGLADHVEIMLFILGIICLGVEIFVLPGYGIFAMLGISLMLISAILAMQTFTLPKTTWDKVMFKHNLLVVGGIFAVSVPFFLVALFSASKLIISTRLGHNSSEAASEGFTPSENYAALMGKIGTTVTLLRSAGAVEIDGRRYDVVSDGEFIESGTPVRVTEIVGNRIVVRRL